MIESRAHIRRSHKEFPVFDRYENVDIAIIGGGIVGIASAYELSRHGYNVALLEKNKIGHSSSGISTGIVLPIDYELVHLVEYVGENTALNEYRENLKTAQRFGDLARKLDITSYRESGSLGLVLDDENDANGLIGYLNTEIYFRRKHGLPEARLLFSSEARSFINSPKVVAAIHYGRDEMGNIDANEMLEKLTIASISNGARIYERSGAKELTHSANGIKVTTDSGEIVARRVIVATQGLNLDGSFSPFIWPKYSHIFITEPLEEDRITVGFPNNENAWTINDKASFDYMRPTSDGRFIYGGEDVEAKGRRPWRHRTSEERFARLYSRMIGLLPALDGVKMDSRRRGFISFSPDYLPIVEFDDGIYRIHSVTAAGLIKALTIARLMPEELDGRRPKYFEMIDAKRFL